MFWPLPSEDQLKGAKPLCTVGQKMAVKVYHAEEALQLFDILRGWAEFNFGGVIGRRGAPAAEIVWPRISREGVAKMHFSRLMVRPLVAKAAKPPDGGGVFACLESQHLSCPCMQTHLLNHLWCNPSFFEMFLRRWTAQIF
jgi:hypothetical protein